MDIQTTFKLENPLASPSPALTAVPQPLLSVIMPIYNEKATIRRVIEKVQNVDVDKEIIMIDDCSKDGTRDVLKSYESEVVGSGNSKLKSKMKFLFHDVNQGKGAAIRTGIQHAAGKIIIIQDADLEYEPEEYGKIIQPILDGKADVVFGSRFRGDIVRVLFFWHMLGNKLLTLLSNMCTNLNLTDMETCYKAFKSEIIRNIPLRSNRFGFEPEVTAKVAKLRCSIFEVPISYNGRTYAEGKKIGWKDGIAAIYTILKFWLIDDLYEKTTGLRSLKILEGGGVYNEWLYGQCKGFLGKRVLETGAGVGNFTKYLAGREAVFATDVVPFFLDDLKARYNDVANVKVFPFDLLDKSAALNVRATCKPDTILSINSIQHIDNDSEAFKNVNRSLEKNGRFVLVLPSHPFLFSDMDKNLGYFRRYDKSTLELALREAGFRIFQSRCLNTLGAIGWFVNGKIFRKKLIPSRQIRIFDWLVGLLALEKLVTLPFGLSVLVVAEKEKDI